MARAPLLRSGWCGQGEHSLGGLLSPDLLGLGLRRWEEGEVSRHGIVPVLFSFNQP